MNYTNEVVLQELIKALKPTDCGQVSTKDGALRNFFIDIIDRQLPIAFLEDDIGKLTIQLHDKEGLSFRQIGREYGYPESTLRYWRVKTLEYAVRLTPVKTKKYILYLKMRDEQT